MHSDGGQKSETGQHQLALQWALFGLPLLAACCEALGEMSLQAEPASPRVTVSVFPLVGGAQGGGEVGREGSRWGLKGTF